MGNTPFHARYAHRNLPGCVLSWDHETVRGQDVVLLLGFLQLRGSSGENASIPLGDFFFRLSVANMPLDIYLARQ